MKRRNAVRRNGAVLLMILGLMAMFALSVLSYMIITSNMAETAQTAQKIDSVQPVPVQSDLDYAIKNVLVGSDNEANPIGPFSILENMYGDWKIYDSESVNSTIEFGARIAIIPHKKIAIVAPDTLLNGNAVSSLLNDSDRRGFFTSLFENSGNVLTFRELDQDNSDEGISAGAVNAWNTIVQNTSARVLDKVITNPTNSAYNGDGSLVGDYWYEHYNEDSEDISNKSYYGDFDFWHFKVDLSEELLSFVNELNRLGGTELKTFNHSYPVVTVRLNLPAYSGTGVGGFSPGKEKDVAVAGWMVDAQNALRNMHIPEFAPNGIDPEELRIPYVFWANAAAPDFQTYKRFNSGSPSFRTFWAHLTDVTYNANDFGSRPSASGSFVEGVSVAGGYSGNGVESPRLNSSYTAPDERSLFLARYQYSRDESGNLVTSFIPSFHRPSMFQMLANGYLDMYNIAYRAQTSNHGADALMTGLIRRLTPRPLPYDHWNFSGGNAFLDYWRNDADAIHNHTTDLHNYNSIANIFANVQGLDVDNDGDGARDGVWTPSGLPIRYDQNGTPYATMFSYLILDMDGRINVNTAGNWDQLPHAYGNGDYFEPFYYLKEYDDVLGRLSGSISFGEPFYYADAPSFGKWFDDNGNDISAATASAVQRGEGRGTSGVVLYEGLQKIFHSFGSNDVRRFATQLLWRRYKSRDENFRLPTVDGGTLTWRQDGIADADDNYVAQPGLYNGGVEADDALGTREKFFRYIDPMRLYDFDYNSDTLTIAQAKIRFPWRGKTTVVDMGANANLLPAFDFADTAFRSYDPLGNQVFTYAPRFSNNPYLAYQNVRTFNDSAYTITALERLLRPFDADAVNLPNELAADLEMTGDSGGNFDVMDDRNVARHTLTTISSDVPSPSMAFPENFVDSDNVRYGNYGFVDLIRRNVRSELRRVFEAKGIVSKETRSDVDSEGNPISVDVEGTNLYLDGNDLNAAVFNRIVEKITLYLVSMLPKEILRGEKIDLNALAQKNYWVDVDYSKADNRPSDSLRVDGSGDFIVEDTTGKTYNRDLHNAGLVKRMEYARGLYLVMMTLLYEDMNGKRLYDADGELDDADETAAADPDSYPNYVEQKLSNYIEGSFDLLRFEKLEHKDQVKDLMARELMATRIAQWCANVVDFSDPDATMTPFFFDPTPFDGWWVKDYAWLDGETDDSLPNVTDLATITSTNPTTGETVVNNKWKGEGASWAGTEDPFVNFLFAPNQGVVTEQMFNFFKDALDNSVSSNGAASCYVDFNGVSVGDIDEATGAVTRYLPSNELIARWTSKEIKDLHDQSTDLGFRVVWGMERPDLVLTETLNFHDLGIADTELETGVSDPSAVSEEGDQNFDQVKRPQGSTYMEFYCTANPNTPQSPELYDYDASIGQWRLRLSKTTPVYIDSQNRELNMPVWRVAISDSADPRGLNAKKNGMSEEDSKELAKGKGVVYRKAFNSVLNRLTPRKDGDKFLDDFNFFSMQPRQFRNLPTPTISTKINSIADLDLDQGLDVGDKVKEPDASFVLNDWKPFNLYASNVLGSAVAAKDEDARVKEVELDRILWFTHPQGDTVADPTNLGTAGEYPDALRTFGRESDGTTYLSPNQYLVVGPATKRSIGSASYQSTATDDNEKRFGQDPSTTESFIDLNAIGKANLGRNYETMVAVANIGGQGLNISEPLWTSKVTDPYYAQSDEDLKNDEFSGRIKVDLNPADPHLKQVRDIPFEMPNTWGDREDFDRNNDGVVTGFYRNRVANYPIVQDELFGVGTVPGYKSAFVQRVADPNRPYHPLMNPYITVDWNMMDLTVFTGENANATLKAEIEADTTLFTRGDAYPYKDKVNKIQFARNTALGFDDDEADKTYELDFKSAFSSRQWGSQAQKTFAPDLSSEKRPNIWARAFKSDGNKAGLEAPREIVFTTGTVKSPVICRIPRHTFGHYNNIGAWGSWGTDADGNEIFTEDDTVVNGTYKGLNQNYLNSGDVYTGTPNKPFETLVWSDAPFSNPYEVMTVPASSAGRFGLEFVRDGSEGFDVSKLYRVDGNKKGSLGSFGLFGFDDWYTDKNIKVNRKDDKYEDANELKGIRNKVGAQGAYLNFYASSKKAGDCLNLCRFLDFVTVPSLYLGSKKLAVGINGNTVTDEYGNPEFRSTLREPGKINLNTASEAALNAVSPINDRSSTHLPGTPWQDFVNSRLPYETGTDASGNSTTTNSSFAFFQPAHTANLWVQMDGTKPPVPAYATLLAPETCDLANNTTKSADSPIFDSISQAYELDASGNVVYEYVYIDPDTGERLTAETSDLDWLENNMRVENEEDGTVTGSVLSYEKKKTERPGNIYAATAEAQRLSGLTTNKSNVFAVWVTVGYFEVERCEPGVNMPKYDPDGNEITLEKLADPNYAWYRYYQAIYPDGYTYGKELGSDYGETQRHRGFSIIDRSIPVDYRRGSSLNWEKAVLVRRVID